MKQCISLSSISPTINCVDLDNRAGVVNCILLGFADEVGTWPNLPYGSETAPLSMEMAGKWNGNLAMANGCKLYKLTFTDETGELKITDQGEKGSKQYLYELELSRAKMNATMFGFENAIKDRKLVILVRDRNGLWYIMGDKMAPAMMVDGDGSTTGKAGTDQNRTSLKFQYTCPRKLVYAGDVDSLMIAADESNTPDNPNSNDYSDTNIYTILDIGSQVHSTGDDEYDRWFPVENNSQVDDIYEALDNIVAQGKIPVLKATLVSGDKSTVIKIALSKVAAAGGFHFSGSGYTQDGLYLVSVYIAPVLAESNILLSIEPNP